VVKLSPEGLARVELRAMADRESDLKTLIFDVGYQPALLPEGTPDYVVSAWLRLQHARKDLDLIERWLK
jgi:hypothetical protein